MGIEINHIGKRFGSVQALQQVSLEIEEGELFGLIGPDGAGKTTLFRIMASLLLPDEGSCRMLGLDSVKDFRKIRQIIGYMPGRFSLYMDLTVEENLAFYARVFGSSVDQHYDLIRDVYEQIAPFKKRRAGKLSGGMKQKLALSCALIHRPRVLILDEPTTGVDAVSRQEFWEMLKKIQQQGISVVVSTPYMDEAERCDRVALMQKGRVLSVSSPSGLGVEEEEELLYSLQSERGVYGYLEIVRKIRGVKYAWLFGDSVHVGLTHREAAGEVEKALDSRKDDTLVWKPIRPSIEDRFMFVSYKSESL